MRLLLTSAEDVSAFPEGKAKAYPKLGLLSLVSYLRQHMPPADLPEMYYHDMVLEGIDADGIGKLVTDLKPDVLAISALSFSQAAFHDVAAAAKRALPTIVIVGGGPYPSSLRNGVLNDTNVDVLVYDEGEATFLELIRCLSRGESLGQISGIAFRDVDGRIKTTTPRELIPSLDSLPLPAIDLVDLDSYAQFNPHLDTGGRFFPIVTSRGCPFTCIYCHDLHGKRTRFRSPENVLAEIEHLYKEHGVRCFYVYDDIFNVRKDRAKEICRRIIDSDMTIAIDFLNGLRADLMDHELIDLMLDAGTYYFAYAVETATPRLQDLIQKHNKLDMVADAIEYTVSRSDGRCVVATYNMIGFPTETEDEVWNTIEFNRSLSHHIADVAITIPQEHTALFEMVSRMGIQLPAKRSPNYGSDVMLSASERISPDRLSKLLKEFKSAFYDADRIDRLKRLENQPGVTPQLSHLGGFIRGLSKLNDDFLGPANVALWSGVSS